jgi:hypothetical protein
MATFESKITSVEPCGNYFESCDFSKNLIPIFSSDFSKELARPRKQSSRLSIFSTKQRQKWERKNLLEISMRKLMKIRNPQRNLRRSVVIKNTAMWLQKEVEDLKMRKLEVKGWYDVKEE